MGLSGPGAESAEPLQHTTNVIQQNFDPERHVINTPEP